MTTLVYIITRVRDHQTAGTALSSLLKTFSVATVDDVVIRQALAWGWNDFENAPWKTAVYCVYRAATDALV